MFTLLFDYENEAGHLIDPSDKIMANGPIKLRDVRQWGVVL